VLVAGFLYDLIGRTKTTVTVFIMGAFATFMVPVVAPSIVGYHVFHTVFLLTLVVMLSNPFINDYVQVQCRGVATGFQTIGMTVGNLLSVGLLFTLTEETISNKLVSYGMLAGLQICWAIIMWWMIDEPDTMNASEEKHQKKKSLFGRLWSMLKLSYKACKQDPALLISLIALIPSRNTANLQQVNFQAWLQTFKLPQSESQNVW